MENLLKNEKGITLVALVVTIVVLIILAGISINLAVGNNGIVSKAKQAKEMQEMSDLHDRLELIRGKVALDNDAQVTWDKYKAELIKENVITDDSDVTDSEDGSSKDIVTDTGYVAEIEIIEPNAIVGKIEIIGKKDNLPVKIIGVAVTHGKNSLKVDVTAKRTENATFKYYYKTEGGEYQTTPVYEGTDLSYTITNLTENIKYTIKVQATNKNGTVEKEVVAKTGEVASAEGVITFDNLTWTSGKASVKVNKTTSDDLQIQYKVNTGSYAIITSGATVSNMSLGDVLTVRLYDGMNYGNSASLTIADTTVPNAATISLSNTSVTAGASLTATVTQTDNESGVKITSCKWVFNTTSSSIGTTESSYTGGTFNATPQTITLSTTTIGTYYLHVLTIDNAGNKKETISASIATKTTVNAPKITGTGLVPVTLATDGTATDVTDLSSDWYDYNTTSNSSRWANAVTKDSSGKITGYFVWIPRYEYKISGTTVTVQFIDTSKTTADSGYLIHPAFASNVANGGWDSEISGFWVAKYPAGYQASTINASGTLQNSSDTVARSSINYSGIDNSYTANPVDSSLSTSTKMSYPVFKPLTYAYNCTRIGDMYTLSRNIQSASAFYGLSGVDSHLEKNSEWGAVAYLTQSSYGRNGTEVNINNYSMNNTNSKNTYCVTGLYGAGTSDSYVTAIGSVNAYNTSTGIKGSSTGNITGVYDLNGCIYECTASYITNGNASLSTYGSSFAYTTADTTPQTNGRSTKWATAYPYDSSNDSFNAHWTKYNSYKSSTYGYGDAILETSTSGCNYTSWNGDYSSFPCTSAPFFLRGGSCYSGSAAGAFSFFFTYGKCAYNYGFRVVLCG